MPQFLPGEIKTAKVPMKNPTAKTFDYVGTILMGTTLVEVSRQSFSLNAGEEKVVNFPITMPLVAGTYPVYIGVFSGGQSIALYKATEDVVIVSPAIVVSLDLVTLMGLSLDKLEYWNPITATYQLTCPTILIGQTEGIRATIGEWLVQKDTTWPSYCNCWEWILAYTPGGVEVARIIRDMHSIYGRGEANKVTVIIELKWTCSQAGSYSVVVGARNVPTW